MMDQTPERNLGEQPIAARMDEKSLGVRDLVAASTEQLTHKMVTKARKGRRLSPNVQGKVLRAFNAASEQELAMSELFNY